MNSNILANMHIFSIGNYLMKKHIMNRICDVRKWYLCHCLITNSSVNHIQNGP